MNIIITGGHSGLGFELTKMVLADGYRVGLIVRNEERIANNQALQKWIGVIDFFYADLSDQGQIVSVADEIAKKWNHVDILFNNAAVLLPTIERSKQGNEMHFEVNTLAPYLLTLRLKDAFSRSKHPKVINTVSDSMAQEKKIAIETLLNPVKMKKLFGSYLQSKLALTCLMNDLSKDSDWAAVQIINVTPGPNKTQMTKSNGMPKWLLPIRNIFFKHPKKGAKRIYDAAFDSRHLGKTGIFLKNNTEKRLKVKLSESQKEQLVSNVLV